MNGKKSGSGRKRTKAASLSWRVVGLERAGESDSISNSRVKNGKMGGKLVMRKEQKG